MSTISERIAEVLRARHHIRPRIDREQEQWERVQNTLHLLERAVDDVKAADLDQAVAAGIALVDVAALQRLAARSLAELASAQARVSRPTVNIGVSGRARNGKSTLLQSLSGLGDGQIPARAGGAVTAVRSRIYHSTNRREATLTMHTEQSFCDDVIAPYHQALGIAPELATLAELAKTDYAEVHQRIKDRTDFPSLGPMLRRLQEMQAALGSFRGLLTGQQRTVPLDQLRPWVAYPAEADDTNRPYLAVRDAVIHCEFPVTDVASLGLIDLPGLGELVPNAEEHHLAGLHNDVDFVLVVKRPADTNTIWSAEDGQALGLIGKARGAADIRDFAAILVNTGGCAEVNVKALTDDILHRLNERRPDSVYRVIEADAADREVVRTQVLGGVLAHLAEALPRMDAAVIGRAVQECHTNREHILAVVDGLLAQLRTVITPTPTELLIARASGLRAELAASVQGWVHDMEARTEDGYEDDEFTERVAQVQADIRNWVVDGFGQGVDGWAAAALDRMRVDKAAGPFATDALNSTRVEIARRFGAIDDILTARRDEFWQGLIDALGPLAPLLAASNPQDALRDLANRLSDANEPCPTLSESVDFVLDVRMDYRTRVLPRLRRALNVLQPEPASGEPGALAAILPVPRTQEGADEMFLRLSQLAREAVHDAGILLADEPAYMAQVLFAYAEQFEDAFIRSEASEAEFRRLSESFRDELWPGATYGPGLATARIQRVRGGLNSVRDALTGVDNQQEGPHA
ncbi:hypothetical protein [Catellatospora sp. NPDC049609]|uniref:hypothetical protein n=1 Tax=Catellatospora sp. NPDC049609 TaxID=3155505 RepID=UPI00341AF824